MIGLPSRAIPVDLVAELARVRPKSGDFGYPLLRLSGLSHTWPLTFAAAHGKLEQATHGREQRSSGRTVSPGRAAAVEESK